MVEAEVVREQIRNAPLEAIQLGQGIVAEREQNTHAQSGASHELGELAREAGLLGVVEEVLLGLVEHEQQVAGERLRPAAEGVRERLSLARIEERGAELLGQRVANRLAKRGHRVVAPLVVDDDDVLRVAALFDVLPRVCSQAMRYSGAQQRALADPARAVQHRQAGGEDVRADDPDLSLAAEEEEGVELGVLERSEALVGARDHVGATSSSRRSSPSTRSSSSTS